MTDQEVSILVVDDEAFNIKFIQRQLKQEGYTNISTAGDGKEAIEMMQKTPFDLVLLDIEMPEMNGYEVLEHVKADMRLRDVPIIIISSVDDIESIARCIEMGAEDYLPKPFNPILLRARLGASIEKKKNIDKQATFMDQIREEKKRSDKLLEVILPFAAARELKSTGKVAPRSYDEVAVMFCDIVSFTSYCSEHTADEVVGHLDQLIDAYEEISAKYQMEKIKTIGDEYMATAGLLTPNRDPLLSCVQAGLEMVEAAKNSGPNWEVRVGVNVGTVVAGIVGKQKYQFDVWGNTVNVAARMASYGKPGGITMPQELWHQVEHDCLGRSLGNIDVKGKGAIDIVECYGLR